MQIEEWPALDEDEGITGVQVSHGGAVLLALVGRVRKPNYPPFSWAVMDLYTDTPDKPLAQGYAECLIEARSLAEMQAVLLVRFGFRSNT